MMGPILGGVARLKFTSAVNIVCDGNSLTNGHGTGTPYPTQLATLSPVAGSGATVVNLGISGQQTSDMTANSADVEAAWMAGNVNLLALLEGTNSFYYGASAAQAKQDMTTYIAARRATKRWKIILLTCPPRQTGGSDAQHAAVNATIDAYNALLRAEYRAMGADLLVDLRQAGYPWSPANFPDYTTATFNASAATGIWANEPGGYTHFSSAGYLAIAQMVAAGLKRLPAR